MLHRGSAASGPIFLKARPQIFAAVVVVYVQDEDDGRLLSGQAAPE